MKFQVNTGVKSSPKQNVSIVLWQWCRQEVSLADPSIILQTNAWQTGMRNKETVKNAVGSRANTAASDGVSEDMQHVTPIPSCTMKSSLCRRVAPVLQEGSIQVCCKYPQSYLFLPKPTGGRRTWELAHCLFVVGKAMDVMIVRSRLQSI